MNAEKVYNQFIEWIGKSWWELPESEFRAPMIKACYTPTEADFLTGFPLQSVSLEDLVKLKQMPPEELEPLLLELGRKGMIYKSKRGDSVRYRLNETFFALLRASFWSGREDERTKSSAPVINKYFLDNWFEKYNQVHHRGLRILPIAQTIQDDRTILPYEDVVKVIDSFEYYTVSTCPCRQRHNLDPDMKDCHHPLETCLHFDELGHAKSLDASNCRVQVSATTCKACGLCLKRCPMDALQLTHSTQARNKFSKVVDVNLESCIGCGVCVHKCPTESLTLVGNQTVSPPPKTVRDYMQQYLKDRAKAKRRLELSSKR
jgi:formate hydrogenlyase subunit 6/NADH:ubiquinone oxidoreductase subunit I